MKTYVSYTLDSDMYIINRYAGSNEKAARNAVLEAQERYSDANKFQYAWLETWEDGNLSGTKSVIREADKS